MKEDSTKTDSTSATQFKEKKSCRSRRVHCKECTKTESVRDWARLEVLSI